MNQIIETLKHLGLTEYEARAYVGLVSAGSATAGMLSKTANIPYSRIYDVLSRLESRGWVEIQSGRPSRYRARSPADVLHLLKTEKEKQLRELTSQVLRELEPLYNQTGEVKKPEIWIIRRWDNIHARALEIVSRAQTSILISLPLLPPKLRELLPFLSTLREKDIEIRVLTTKKLHIPGIETRRRETLFGGGIIVDGKEVLLTLGSGSEVVGLWSNEVGLARFAEEYFEYLWRDSKSL